MEQKNEPVQVFDAFNAAVNGHDTVAALSFFADDAVVQFPNQPLPNRYQGRSEIREWLERDAAQGIRVETSDLASVNDTVTGTGRVDVTEMRAAGAKLEGDIEVIVRQGKITSFKFMVGE